MKKQTTNQNSPKTTDDREIDIFKGITHFRKQSGQTIRMSLTLRIAAHYCGEYSQLVIQDAMVSAQVSQESMPGDAWGRFQFGLKHLFQKDHFMQVCFAAQQKTGTHQTVLIYHNLKRELFCFAALLLIVVILDVRRMIYFLAHHDRLDRTLLRPIQEMTEKAAAVSANNLSNRINVEGTKNELRDLAVVINSMLDRLEVSYESQKQFVSDASHELRTPIAVIQGYADMLGRWGKDDPQVLQ